MKNRRNKNSVFLFISPFFLSFEEDRVRGFLLRLPTTLRYLARKLSYANRGLRETLVLILDERRGERRKKRITKRE